MKPWCPACSPVPVVLWHCASSQRRLGDHSKVLVLGRLCLDITAMFGRRGWTSLGPPARPGSCSEVTHAPGQVPLRPAADQGPRLPRGTVSPGFSRPKGMKTLPLLSPLQARSNNGESTAILHSYHCISAAQQHHAIAVLNIRWTLMRRLNPRVPTLPPRAVLSCFVPHQSSNPLPNSPRP